MVFHSSGVLRTELTPLISDCTTQDGSDWPSTTSVTTGNLAPIMHLTDLCELQPPEIITWVAESSQQSGSHYVLPICLLFLSPQPRQTLFRSHGIHRAWQEHAAVGASQEDDATTP